MDAFIKQSEVSHCVMIFSSFCTSVVVLRFTPLLGNSAPPQAACGGNVGHTYLRPKDSNAVVGVSGCATQKVPEGYDRQTDQTTLILFFSAPLRKISTVFSASKSSEDLLQNKNILKITCTKIEFLNFRAIFTILTKQTNVIYAIIDSVLNHCCLGFDALKLLLFDKQYNHPAYKNKQLTKNNYTMGLAMK